jgi:phage baseplate assembly protein W
MTKSATWPLAPDATSGSSSTAGLVAPGQPTFLGRGILSPFRRDQKNDFANGTGLELVKSSIRQILLTKAASPSAGGGELPWRTDFGSLLHLIRHRRNNVFVAQEIARAYVLKALQAWETRVQVTDVKVTSTDRTMTLKIIFNVTDQNNNIIARDAEVELPLLAA